jgi:hypothetical protein
MSNRLRHFFFVGRDWTFRMFKSVCVHLTVIHKLWKYQWNLVPVCFVHFISLCRGFHNKLLLSEYFLCLICLFCYALNLLPSDSRSRNNCCSGKAISITYSECVSVALVIQHVKRMRLILPSVACPALPYFFTLSYKRHDFRKTLLNIKCAFWFSLQLLPKTFLILRRIQRDTTINLCMFVGLHVKYPLCLSYFNEMTPVGLCSNHVY